MSSLAADAANYMMPSIIRRRHTSNDVQHEIPKVPRRVPEDPNRVLEVLGLMGAIGEQLGLALTADLDARRLISEAGDASSEKIAFRLRIRAMSEMSAYYTLGAGHSLANLTLRILLLYPKVALQIDPGGRKYPVGDDSRKAWETLRSLSSLFKKQEQTTQGALRELIAAVIGLQSSAAFKALDERRGMDFHRRRPQSVEHRAPTAGIYTNNDGLATLRIPAPALQPEAVPDVIHAASQTGLRMVAQTMRLVRTNLGPALREEGFTYIW
jgi:hypothetical protein